MSLQTGTRTLDAGVAVVTPSGEIDVYSSPQFRQEVTGLLEGGVTRIIVDLNEIDYMDSTGVGVLMALSRRVAERKGELRLVCRSARLLRIFELTGLKKVFDIHPTEAEAVESLPPDA